MKLASNGLRQTRDSSGRHLKASKDNGNTLVYNYNQWIVVAMSVFIDYGALFLDAL